MELRKDIINLYKLAVKYDKTHEDAINLTTKHYYYKIHDLMTMIEFKDKVIKVIIAHNAKTKKKE